MMLPECAELGTVTTSPEPALRRCAAGELELMRAPRWAGKATSSPARRPRPASNSVPWIDTWWGLVLQLAAGVQRTLEIRAVATRAPLLGAPPDAAPPATVVEVPAGGEPAGAAPPGDTPPAFAAGALLAALSAKALAAARTARKSVRMRAALLAKRFPSRAAPPDGGVRD